MGPTKRGSRWQVQSRKEKTSGYKKDQDAIVIDEKEALVVRRYRYF